ncbi:urease accessory protein UreF [Desertimonas flava]|uniref:urease accessory protein UreF n=1 Tax=Desertimonas flava TaxID=2064846 RepID=UPI001D0CDC7E|nr:urease accessory UreF family protein [Desertimonas flava]
MIDSLLGLLLLGDGRFPAGGHAHSAGVEAAIADGRVTDEASLEAFVAARLATVGLVDAAIAAATLTGPLDLDALRAVDAEADARILVPALRRSSRRLGRQLARASGRCWPDAVFVTLAEACPDGAHQSVAIGCAGSVIGASADQIAALALHHAATTPAQAGVRLLGLDPVGVAAIVARLAPLSAALAADAVAAARGPLTGLPASSSPMVDIAATAHAAWETRHFAT